MAETEQPAGKPNDEHLQAWADLHRTESPKALVGGWLRVMAAVARPMVRAGVSPNAVSVGALVAAAGAVPLARMGGPLGPLAACAAVTASGILDSLDGAVAVQAERTTSVGFLLDSSLDRLADALGPVALAAVVSKRHPGRSRLAGRLAVAGAASAWWLEYVRARGSLAAAPDRQVATPGERPTRIILTVFGLGLPSLAGAALGGQVIIVGTSALYLFGSSLRRLSRHDRAGRDRAAHVDHLSSQGGRQPVPTE